MNEATNQPTNQSIWHHILQSNEAATKRRRDYTMRSAKIK